MMVQLNESGLQAKGYNVDGHNSSFNKTNDILGV